jgi:group I intron endonuclease
MKKVDKNLDVKQLLFSLEDLTNIFQKGVYKIIHLDKPELCYIGSATMQGKNIARCGFYIRWLRHFQDFKKGTHHSNYLQRVVNKYGINNLRFIILEVCESVEESLEKEQYYLDILNPEYNACKIATNSSGFKHSKITKLKMSTSRKGKKKVPMSLQRRQAIAERMKKADNSHLHTLESIRKRSEKLRGKKRASEIYDVLRKPICQYSKEGSLLNCYPSIEEAKLAIGIKNDGIGKVARGLRKTAAGFIWKYQ